MKTTRLLLLCLLNACATTAAITAPTPPSEPATPTVQRARRRTSIDLGPYRNDATLFFEQQELATVNTEGALRDQSGNTFFRGKVPIPDVKRQRYGIEYRGGAEILGFTAAAYREDFFDGVYELFGVRLGIDGTPRLLPDSTVSPIVDYAWTLAYQFGDGDIPVLSQGGSRLATADATMSYGETTLRAGVGVDVQGVQLSVGAQAAFLYGSVDIDRTPVSPPADSLEFDAFNVGGYLRARYRAAEIPIVATVQASVGDLSGILVQLGVRF